tara:strand:+ start:1080 stop:2306 length:1227 start_codon:yes stop_codon:yes gene_type:complete
MVDTALREPRLETTLSAWKFWQWVYSSTDRQFWLLQAIGWVALMLISFLSLTLWYNQQQLNYILHTALQSLLGVCVSWPLRPLFRAVWERSAVYRLTMLVLGILVASISWTVLRLATFMGMTVETGLWSDFGGWLWGSILIFIGWAALYHGIKYYQLLQSEHESLLRLEAQNKEFQLQRSRAELVAREAQLKMLRYQLNPHFLFNTLNAISALVRTKKALRANAMIVQLSDFLRYSLDNDPIQSVTLEEEMTAVRLYLDIEKTRFGERLQLHFDIEQDALNVQIPSLILQPLVENAIKYAIAPEEFGGKITVVARLVGDYCAIKMLDTGRGGIALANRNMFELDADARTGVGLRNTIDRLENFYGDRYLFQLTAADCGGLCVEIRIPIVPVRLEDTDCDGTANWTVVR